MIRLPEADFLRGGSGADSFVYRDGDDSVVGRGASYAIADFSHTQRDKIDLKGIDADTAAAGDQSFTFIGTKSFSGKAGELHYVKDAGGWYVEGDTNGDLNAEFRIYIDNKVNFVASDFIL